MFINPAQRSVLIIYVIVLILLTVYFVPWVYKGSAGEVISYYGPAPLWQPPVHNPNTKYQRFAIIDLNRLGVEVVMITLAAAALFVAFHSNRVNL